MASLTLRRTKGSPLTHDELDDNFVNLDSDISSGRFDSGLDVYGGIVVNTGDVDIVEGDLILRNGDFKYNPRLAFHDLAAGVDRVIYDSSGGVLVGTDYNGLTSHFRVSRVGNQLIEIGCKTSNSGQNAFIQLGNAGSSNGRSCGVKATQISSNPEDWKLSLVAHNSVDGFIDAIDIDQYGNVSINGKVDFYDSATFHEGIDVDGKVVVDGDIILNGTPITTGGVTSVNVSAPSGFNTSGGPVTSSGTISLTYAGTHSLGLPNNTKQGQWDQAYGWGDHGSAGYLTDAPSNGNQYARKDGGWEIVTSTGGTTYTAGTGINITGGNVIQNTAPDQTVTITGGGQTTVTGTYPNFTVSTVVATDSGGLGLADLSAVNDVTTTPGGELSYSNTTGIFTFKPVDTSQFGLDSAAVSGMFGAGNGITISGSNPNEIAMSGSYTGTFSATEALSCDAHTGIKFYRPDQCGIAFSQTSLLPAAGDGVSLDNYVDLGRSDRRFKDAHFSGQITAGGDVVAFSDITLKENVNPITDALEKVSNLTGITFNRIGDERISTGLSAQELREVLPEAVHEKDGKLAVAYGNVVGLLVEAIKELKEEITQLKG